MKRPRTYLALQCDGGEPHVTIAWVQGRFLPDLPLPDFPLPARLNVVGEGVFGPPEAPCRALILEKTEGLVALRHAAEGILAAVGAPPSTRWPFTPHATIAADAYPEGIPSELTATSLTWRAKQGDPEEVVTPGKRFLVSREDVAANCGVPVAWVPENYADLSDEDLVAAVEANRDAYARAAASPLFLLTGGNVSLRRGGRR